MTHKATRHIALFGALTLGLTLAGTAVQAQPPGGAGNGANPANGGGGNGGRPNWQAMTPEQRTAMIAQFQEQRTRGTLTAYGVTDTKVQDTIVAYSKAQNAARQTIGDASRKVTDALANKAPDAQLFTLFGTLRTLIEAEKARIITDQKTLDTLIGYSKSPRLGIVLTMMGFLGDESNYFGGGGFGGGGFGGRGGGFGGGGNGGGGNGGGGNGGQPAPPAPAPAPAAN